MTIKQLVDDATFLEANGRYLGALAVLLLAVAGSSRKLLPKRTPSIRNPGKDMGDGEAFELFLGPRIRKIVSGVLEAGDLGHSGMKVEFKGTAHTLEHILYKFYRCELAHEAKLPQNVDFLPRSELQNRGISIGNKDINVNIVPTRDGVMLDTGWLEVLRQAVVHAPVNGPEFEIEHHELKPKNGNDDEQLKAISSKHNVGEGRVRILKLLVEAVTPRGVIGSNDQALQEEFKKLVKTGTISQGMITGLTHQGLTDQHERLQPKGLEVVREISDAYDLVRIA